MKKTKLALFITALAVITFACGEAVDSTKVTEETTEDPVKQDDPIDMPNESSFQLDLIIANNIAAPVKLLTDMNEAGLNHYQENVTNPVDKLNDYQTSEQRALIFGVYGADLSYKSLYGRHDEMADYLIVIRKLTDELGLSSLFDQSSFEDFERIKSNSDSVKMFIFDKYDSADEYLRSNDRFVTASLILTGGLIESLHLVSSQIETGDTNKESYRIFLGQKNTLSSLLSLYDNLEAEGHEMHFKEDIKVLHSKFEELDSFDKFSKENMNSLFEAIDVVRNKIV